MSNVKNEGTCPEIKTEVAGINIVTKRRASVTHALQNK